MFDREFRRTMKVLGQAPDLLKGLTPPEFKQLELSVLRERFRRQTDLHEWGAVYFHLYDQGYNEFESIGITHPACVSLRVKDGEEVWMLIRGRSANGLARLIRPEADT